MKYLDHRLRSLVRQNRQTGFIMAESAFAAVEEKVEILARCADGAAVERLKEAGVDVWSVVPGASIVVAGAAPINGLEELGESEGVERLEASRSMGEELDRSRSDSRVDSLHTPPDPESPAVRGDGVIVGIIDSGIDYRHPKFRNSDGTSRILFLWDQRTGGQNSNVPFGREFTKEQLDEALATDEPLDSVFHLDTSGHGTHVAGIAAGNGREGLNFRGVAPDADLIIVAARSNGDTLGRSASSLAAYQYIVSKAAGRPLVINQSQGMNGGGHSGETLLETGIENLLRQPNVVAVKSAGNEQRWRIHAGGIVQQGATETRTFRVRQGNTRTAIFELWYDDVDTISLSVEPPGESALPFVSPDVEETLFETQAGNEVVVLFDRDADETGDTQATVEISPHLGAVIRPGKWRLHLSGDQIEHGRFDVWIERAPRPGGSDRFQARFRSSSADNTRTISVPGTSRRIITVGAYVTRDSPPVGRISDFSSRGPTRYGLQKPEITAPGQSIIAARSSDSNRSPDPDFLHTSMPGTSMAAPHVAGAAALILSQRPGLTCEQVKQILKRSARIDVHSDTAPDDTWGHGKLDARAAIEIARRVVFPTVSDVSIQGGQLSWKTDVPTTATVRFHTSRRRVLLGRSLGTRTQLELSREHSVDLSDLEAGIYFCEILAFSEEGFRDTNDNDGACHEVEVS